ncbi:MAG: hypothetical protein IKP29_01390 [Pseudobutyrivibrio sp.]|nr:hypothetical protein [Pseudobutyrivibrio sp.]
MFDSENEEFKEQEITETVEEAVEGVTAEATPKKSHTGLYIGLGIAGALVVAALIVAFALGLFMSPAQMLAKGIENGKNDFVAAYDTGYKSMQSAYADVKTGDMNMSVGVELGAQAQALVKQFGAEAGVDLGWVKSANADIALDVQDKQLGVGAKAGLNGTELATIEAIIDANSQKAYLSVPEVIDGAVAVNPEMDMQEIVDALAQYTETIKTYVDKYPTSQELDTVLSKYTAVLSKDLATANLKKSKAELSASGLSTKYVDLSMDLDKKTALQLEVDMLEVLINDNDIKEMARPMFNQVLSTPEIKEQFKDYDEFWDYMLEELKTSQADATTELESVKADASLNETYGTLHLYGALGCKVKGFAFEPADSEDAVKAYVIEKKGKSALLVNASIEGDTVLFEGKGENINNVFNGKYQLKYKDEDIMSIELADFDAAAYKENRGCKGHVIIGLDDGLSELIDDDSIAMLALAKYDITFDTEALSGEMGIDVITGEDSLAKLTISYAMDDVADMTIPSKTYDLDSMSDEESYNFIKSLNLAPVVSKLKGAGVPDTLMAPLQQFSDALASGDDYAIMEAFGALTGQNYSTEEAGPSDEDLAYLASLSYDEFSELYKAYYSADATDEEIKMMYDMVQEYYGE